MAMKPREDLKAFTYYLVTEPFRRIVHEFKEIYQDSARDMRNLRNWSSFLLIVGAVSVLAQKYDIAALLIGISVAFRIYYEWRSKQYRHRWKQRKKQETQTVVEEQKDNGGEQE